MKKIAVLLAGMLALSGCRAEVTEDNLAKVHFVKADLELGDKTPEERAYAIKRRLAQIDEIAGDAVVVEGHTAIIGLRLHGEPEPAALRRIQKEAENAAKAADPYLESTSITMNRHIVPLIEEMERKRAG